MLKALEGTVVTKATLSECGDLVIHFSANYVLQIWNDEPVSGADSWFIGYKGIEYYSVEPDRGFVYELSGD